ncbi:MAG TPA: DUF4386 domain-containing protein [Flavisolibacter sp.]|nr:DUF4386 domain-containing protein [Flavisolibacter sp.]
MQSTLPTAETSPQLYARSAGFLYLVLILAGLFSVVFVREKLIVSGNPAATAANLMAHPQLWRAGIGADLFMHVLDVPIMLIIYSLLRPVHKNLALLVLLFNLVQTCVLVANKLNLIAAMLPLQGAGYLRAVETNLLYTQVYLSIKLHDYGFGVGLIFFGFVCLGEGYLIFKSGFLPKTIGVLMALAGLCYLLNSYALLLAPDLEKILFPFIMLPCLVAELSFSLWLLIKGVNVQKWQEVRKRTAI